MGEPNENCKRPQSPFINFLDPNSPSTPSTNNSTSTTTTTTQPPDFFILPVSGHPCPELSIINNKIILPSQPFDNPTNTFICDNDKNNEPCILQVEKYIKIADISVDVHQCRSYKLVLKDLTPTTTTPNPSTTTTTTTTFNPSNINRGLVGWDVGLGRCASFSNTMGITELQNSNYNLLVRNISKWLVKSKTNPQIIILTTQNQQADNALVSCFSNISNNVILSNKTFYNYDGSNLTNTDLFVLTGSYNWNLTGGSDISDNVQTQLVNFVNSGGSILTSEWIMWTCSVRSKMKILKSVFPVNPTYSYHNRTTLKYSKITNDPIVSQGLPQSWNFTTSNISGTESYFTSLKSGVTVFYDSES